MAEKFILEIENGVEWCLYPENFGPNGDDERGKIFDVGLSDRHEVFWKEELSQWLDDPIELTVYHEDKPIYDIKGQGFLPKTSFNTTIGGVIEYLVANRKMFGFYLLSE